MNRAMFSGVAGLKTHQTKMDVIGNNIANVNTYGYKSQRAVFSDIFYQTLKDASAGTANRGGQNPSSVGYGSILSAVQTQMTQSSMQSTGFGLDVAITGEGFFQVMDADGNIFYTKAGLLDYDANGYLTDINGNFVLGTTSADGTPGTQKIRLDNIGSVESKKPGKTEAINGVEYTVTASNATKYGNVSLSFGASEDLPAGLKAVATITNTGAIAVKLNAYEKFSSMTELNNVVNAAITEANGGKPHAAGTFTISANKNVFGTDAVSGGFTGAPNTAATQLTVANPNAFFAGALSIKGFAPGTSAGGVGSATVFAVTPPTPPTTAYTVAASVGGLTYTGTVEPNAPAGTAVTLTGNGTPTAGSLTLTVEKTGSALTAALGAGVGTNPVVEKPLLGGAKLTAVSPVFPATGGVAFTLGAVQADGSYELRAEAGGKIYRANVPAGGGAVTLSTGTAADGTISMTLPSAAQAAASLGVAIADLGGANGLAPTLANHTYKTIASKSAVNVPLTGAQISGGNFGIVRGSITGMDGGAFGGSMKFLETSTDFAGGGTVLGGADFSAKFTDAAGAEPAFWTVTMNVSGKPYSATISKGTLASSLLLKGPAGDYIQVSNPGFDAMNDQYRAQAGVDPAGGNEMFAYTDGTTLEVKPSTPSKDLGLSTTAFALAGGTEGGAVTLDELSSVAIGADGTVSVSHAEKGVVVAGKISLASFANPRGLALEGSNYFSATANSGTPKLCDPGSDGTGALKSSALEMSNVDLSAEFAEMITTQRGFQANSRIITVSDTMLEELINLKR